jgi:hypothetical protein
MGGLVALLLIRRYGVAGVQGLMNIEGNLALRGLHVFRRVSRHTFDELSDFHMITYSMALNTDVRGLQFLQL